MRSFAREALSPEGNGFLTSFLPFVQRIARLGVENSLAQAVLKLTAPGVPDLYQGCELWDLSLVDPDNRRAVDYRQREEMMGEHGVEVDHATLNRWVLKYVPLLEREFRARKQPVGPSWRMDETYVRVKGSWKYLYRAVDKAGATVDFLLTTKDLRINKCFTAVVGWAIWCSSTRRGIHRG